MTRREILPCFAGPWLGPLLFTQKSAFFEQQTRAAERRLFDLINEERTNASLPPLIWSDAIAASARKHSKRMMDGNFFSHTDPELGALSARIDAAGIRWSRCAENIFHSHGWPNPVLHALINWMTSPGHRANILLEGVTHSGLGAARQAEDDWYITQQFIAFPPQTRPHTR